MSEHHDHDGLLSNYGIDEKVILFDCLIYRNIKNKEDQIALQKDLNLWGMHFHAVKCNIMQVSRKRNPNLFYYSLTGQVLEEGMDTKYWRKAWTLSTWG